MYASWSFLFSIKNRAALVGDVLCLIKPFSKFSSSHSLSTFLSVSDRWKAGKRYFRPWDQFNMTIIWILRRQSCGNLWYCEGKLSYVWVVTTYTCDFLIGGELVLCNGSSQRRDVKFCLFSSVDGGIMGRKKNKEQSITGNFGYVIS